MKSDGQWLVVGCLMQHLTTRLLINNLRSKPSLLVLSTYIGATCLHYFYRSGYKNDLSTVKFGAAFLGFTNYNFFLHGFLTLSAFYTQHLIPLMLIPLYITSDISQSYSKMKHNLLPRFLLSIVLTQSFFNIWVSVISFIQRNSSIFIIYHAPTSLFNWVQTPLFFLLAMIILAVSQKPKED